MFQNKPLLIILTITYWLLNVFLHLEFSLLITTPFQLPFSDSGTSIVITNYAMPISILVSISGLILLIKMYPSISQPKFLLTHMAVWLLVMLLINQFLLTTPVEYIHYLQYGILGWLICHCIGSLEQPENLLLLILISTLTNVIDESLQYLAITSKYSFYLDFNDFVLNFWATTLGLIIYLGFQPNTQHQQLNQTIKIRLIQFSSLLWLGYISILSSPWVKFFPEQKVAPGGISCQFENCILYLQRTPEMMGSWQEKFVTGEFYILHWWQGVILMMLIALYLFGLQRHYLSKIEVTKTANKNATSMNH